MLNNNTASKLREMKMSVMAKTFEKQLTGVSELSFEERFGLIVDSEYTTRKNNRLKRLIRGANYAVPGASLEDIEYHADRQPDKTLITRLGNCDYIGNKHNIIILGATGSGKTYLASALGMTANRNFMTAKYVRLPELLGELAIAKVEGNYRKLTKSYKSVQLLILDEWLLTPLKDAEARYKKARPSSAHSSMSAVGARKSVTRHLPMPSATELSTIPTPLLSRMTIGADYLTNGANN
jgi:DNA replication protein DnaC